MTSAAPQGALRAALALGVAGVAALPAPAGGRPAGEVDSGTALALSVGGLPLAATAPELVDAGGPPRGRRAPPFVVDARGHRVEARTIVDGCAVDRDPAGPWGRAPTPPGASR